MILQLTLQTLQTSAVGWKKNILLDLFFKNVDFIKSGLKKQYLKIELKSLKYLA